MVAGSLFGSIPVHKDVWLVRCEFCDCKDEASGDAGVPFRNIEIRGLEFT
jgi:hypothetical protein